MDNVKTNTEKKLEAPSLAETGFLFSIVTLLFITIGAYAQNRNIYSGLLITEFGIILAPPVLLLAIRKYNMKEVLRLNKVSFLNLFIIFSMMAVSIWLVAILNIFNLWLLKSIFGRVYLPALPIDDNSLFVNILLIGGTAGICEETMFRGVIQRSFEKFGAVFSIVITAFLFGMLHMDFQKLLGTFLLGILIGFIVYRTNSLYAGMFAHFTNNTISVLMNYITKKIFPADIPLMQSNENYLNDYFSMLENTPSIQKITLIAVWTGIALFCAAALAGLIWAFVRNTSETNKSALPSRTNKVFPGILAFLPGLLIIAAVYVVLAFRLSGVPLDFLILISGI